MINNLQEKTKDGYRVKKEGSIHFVFRGSDHIGNILAPQLGGDKKTASQYKAVAKHWGKTSNHPSRHSAMEWLKNSHGLTVRLESVEEMITLTEDTTHIFKNQHGHEAKLATTKFSNGDTEYTSHVAPQHKVTGLRTVRHSTFAKADKRLRGLGYKYSGKMMNEFEEYKQKLSGMDNSDIKEHFRRLYDQHVQNGMAPKYFKSPQHIAAMIEKQHQVPSGTYTGRVHEGDESRDQGTTPYSRMENRDKKSQINIVKKNPTKDVVNVTTRDDIMAETFLRIYNEAKNKNKQEDKNPVGDGGDIKSNDIKTKKSPVKTPTGSEEIKLPTTDTHQPGPLIQINPMLNKPYDSPDNGVNDQKKKPATT